MTLLFSFYRSATLALNSATLKNAFRALLLLFGASLPLSAQNAGIVGIVTDVSGSAIQDASVTIVYIDQGVTRQAKTDSQGLFAAPILPPGHYQLSVQHPGFRVAEVKDITLRVGDQPNFRIQLEVGGLEETVDVEGANPLLQTQFSTLGTVVDRQFVENMPLNGRSFQSLIELTAGVVYTNANGSASGQFAVNGQRQDGNTFLVDGASANSGVSNTFGIGAAGTGNNPATSANGSFNTLVSVDNLQEFKIQTSGFAPEYGRSPGAQISLVTRSGTNQFHGSAFNYFRNTVLDANNWFNNFNRLPRAPQRQNDFGGVFGGPILRDELFFFYSYEGLRLLQPTTGSVYVPSVAARSVVSDTRPLLQAFVLPNGPVNPADANTALFNGSWSNPTRLDNHSIRIDYVPTSKMTLFTRYQQAPSQVGSRGGNNTASVLTNTSNRSRSLTLGHTYLVTPSVINDLRFNATWSDGGQISHMDAFAGAIPASDSYIFPPGYNSGNAMFSAPLLNGSTLRTGKNVGNFTSQINAVDSVSLALGGHQLKFGVDYRRLNPTLAPRLYDMQASLQTSARYLAGRVDSVRLQGKAEQEYLLQNFSAFAQDSWKATRRMTLTYGVRWDVNPAASSPNDRPGFVLTPIVAPASSISVLPLGTAPAYPTTYRNLSPRVGVTFQLSQDPQWGRVLRAGYGIFYDTANSASASWQGPYNAQRSMSNVAFPLSAANAIAPTVPAVAPYVITATPAPDLKAPYVHQTNLTLEQALGENQSLTMSYVGAFGKRLLRSETFQINSATVTSATVVTNHASSNYNALQFQFQRRLRRGLQVLSSLTWSHSIDNASDPNSANGNSLQPGFLNRDRGNSDFDVHNLSSTAVSYSLPTPRGSHFVRLALGNWGTDTIYRYAGGTPFNVTGNTVVDPQTGTTYVSRPNVNSGAPYWIDGNYPGGRKVNIAAFTAAPTGTAGNMKRNSLRGFSMHQVDFALRREFSVGERLRLQFRTDAFNIMNHPMFGNPPVSLAQPATFGIANAMLSNALSSATSFSPLYQVGSPRSLQLSLKLLF